MRIEARAAVVLGLASLLAVGAAGAQTADTGPAPAGAPAQEAPAPGTPTQAPSPTEAPPTQAAPSTASAPAPTPAKPAPPPQPPPSTKYRTSDGELRAASLIGATIYNDTKQTIGTISDLLLNADKKVDKAVLSVGGFLGVGSRLVVVPFTDLQVEPDRIVLPGATKVSLENLSAYQSGG